MTSGVILPIQDPIAQKVCSLSGTQQQMFQDKLITLTQLEKDLVLSIKEADKAISNDRFFGAALLVARIVKVQCDIIIGLLSEGTGPGGKAVGLIYDRATLVADAMTGSLSAKQIGQHIAETHVDAGEFLLKEVGKEKAANFVGGAKIIFKTLQGLAEVLEEAKNQRGSANGIKSARLSAENQLKNLRSRISKLTAELAACGKH